jgi:hypothetical protein
VVGKARVASTGSRAARRAVSLNDAPSKLARLPSPVGTSRVSLKPCRLVLRGWPELVSHCAGRAHPPTRERVETRSAPRRGLLRGRALREHRRLTGNLLQPLSSRPSSESPEVPPESSLSASPELSAPQPPVGMAQIRPA